MRKSKAIFSVHHFLWFAFSAILFGLSIIVYIQDTQEAKVAIETALFDGFLASVIVTFFWIIWAKFNKRVFIPSVTWSKAILAFILPITIITGVFIVRLAIYRETRIFAIADFTFYLMFVGCLLTQLILNIYWKNNSEENLT